MAARTDLLTDDGDLPIDARGLMPVGPSDLQVQEDMFIAFPGEWKQFPQNGVGLPLYLKSGSKGIQTLKNKGRQALQNDGYDVGNMQFIFDSNNKLKIVTNASR